MNVVDITVAQSRVATPASKDEAWLVVTRSATPGALGRLFKPFPKFYVHGHDLGRAMLQATIEKLRRRTIENPEIRQIANRATF